MIFNMIYFGGGGKSWANFIQKKNVDNDSSTIEIVLLVFQGDTHIQIFVLV